MRRDPEEEAEREDLLRNISKLLRRLNTEQLRRIVWYINDKWGIGL